MLQVRLWFLRVLRRSLATGGSPPLECHADALHTCIQISCVCIYISYLCKYIFKHPGIRVSYHVPLGDGLFPHSFRIPGMIVLLHKKIISPCSRVLLTSEKHRSNLGILFGGCYILLMDGLRHWNGQSTAQFIQKVEHIMVDELVINITSQNLQATYLTVNGDFQANSAQQYPPKNPTWRRFRWSCWWWDLQAKFGVGIVPISVMLRMLDDIGPKGTGKTSQILCLQGTCGSGMKNSPGTHHAYFRRWSPSVAITSRMLNITFLVGGKSPEHPSYLHLTEKINFTIQSSE